jgi:predicted nucleic-acid-binding protein
MHLEEVLMARSATIRKLPTNEPPQKDAVVETTLLELVQTLGELTPDDREVVATVIEMLQNGRVRLIGNFRGQRIALA